MKRIFTKNLFALLISAMTSAHASACHCNFSATLAERAASTDQIFIGRVFAKAVRERVYYSFSVSQKFKGDVSDTITIKTGFGGGDCGVELKIGDAYLVYAIQNYTDRCHRTRLAQHNPDVVKLRYLFQNDFARSVGKTADSRLTDNEATYFNFNFQRLSDLFLLVPTGFDFRNKRIAFYYDDKLISKLEYFQRWGGNHVQDNLIILTSKERHIIKDYNAVIVIRTEQIFRGRQGKLKKLEKHYTSKRFRKKVIQTLKTR